MMITVKLFASLRIGRFKQEQRECPDGTTCGQIVADIGVRGEELGMVLVNGHHTSLEKALHDGDSLAIFPLLGGG